MSREGKDSTSANATKIATFVGVAAVASFLFLHQKRARNGSSSYNDSITTHITGNGKSAATNNSGTGSTMPLFAKPIDSSFRGKNLYMDTYYSNLLKELPNDCNLLFKHFMRCLQTPRPSGKLDKMRTMLHETVTELGNGITIDSDNIGNIVIRKSASKGFENNKGCIIQCHMDMVCTANQEIAPNFNFETESIKAYIDGDWLKAKGTTLGADDGIGVAAGLALLEDPGIVHGPLEILITVDEETTMFGAMKLGEKQASNDDDGDDENSDEKKNDSNEKEDISKFLLNRTLINVDSEQENEICIGCAGGFEKVLYFELKRTNTINNNLKCYKLDIRGLLGGHTGIQIHLGRANANILLVRLLNYVIHDCEIKLQLCSMDGGNAANAIPSYGYAIFLVSKNDSKKLENEIKTYWNNYIKPEFQDIETSIVDFDDKKSKVSLTEIEIDDQVGCTELTTSRFVSSLMSLPHGVIRMNPSVEGLVQTSISFSLIKLENDSTQGNARLFGRSPSLNEMLELSRKLDSYARSVGCGISKIQNLFEGWDPNTRSNALMHCKNGHKALFNNSDAKVYAVHAGLECGIILAKYPTMDCISIGPTIHGAHSPDEMLKISSVKPFYQWLRETVCRIASEKC